MAVTAARLVAEVTADTAGAERDLHSFSEKLGGAGKATTLLAGVTKAFGAAAVMAFGKKALTAASDLDETLNKTRVTFGGASAQVESFADRLNEKFGTSRTVMLDAAGAIGLIAQGAGVAKDASAAMSVQLAGLAADAESFYNVPLPEVLGAIRSGLVGESEPLRRFGVLLNESAVQAEALRLGLAKEGEALSDNAKITARASLITAGFKTAQGDLERTSDSYANTVRRLQGRVESAIVAVGRGLQPAVVNTMLAFERAGPMIGAVGEFLRSNLEPVVREVGRLLAALAPIVGNVVKAMAPIVGLGVAAAFVGITRAITGLLQVVNPVLEFFGENEVAATALVAVLTGALLPALAQVVARFVAMVATQVWTWLSSGVTYVRVLALEFRTLAAAQGVAAASTGTLKAAMAGIGGPLALVAAAIGFVTFSWQKDKKAAQEWVRELAGPAPKSALAFARHTDTLIGKHNRLVDVLEQGSNSTQLFGDLALYGSSSAADLSKKINVLHGEISSMLPDAKQINDNIDAVRQATGMTAEEVDRLASRLGVDLKGATQEVVPALLQAASTLDVMPGSAKATNDAIAALADTTLNATERSKAFKTALDALIGIHVNAEQAAIKWHDAIQVVTDAIGTNGRTLDITTEKGRKNRTAILDLISAAQGHAQAVMDQGGSVLEANSVLATHRDELGKTLTKLGLTKDEVARYVGLIGTIPDQIATEIQATIGLKFADQESRLVWGRGPTRRWARGGFITTPQVGLIGEAGPELVLPLSDMNRTQELLAQAGLAGVRSAPTMSAGVAAGLPGGGGGTTVVVNVAGSVVAEQQLAESIRAALLREERRG